MTYKTKVELTEEVGTAMKEKMLLEKEKVNIEILRQKNWKCLGNHKLVIIT